jgi:hypothetical protein
MKFLIQTPISLLKILFRSNIEQVSFVMTLKMIQIEGMKTDPEFPDMYLNFIRQHDIPSALQRDHAKSEMSQRFQQKQIYLLISDQWKEPQIPWQNQEELNGAKY